MYFVQLPGEREWNKNVFPMSVAQMVFIIAFFPQQSGVLMTFMKKYTSALSRKSYVCSMS